MIESIFLFLKSSLFSFTAISSCLRSGCILSCKHSPSHFFPDKEKAYRLKHNGNGPGCRIGNKKKIKRSVSRKYQIDPDDPHSDRSDHGKDHGLSLIHI